MARMGTYFEEQVARRYPQFPVRTRRSRMGRLSSPLGPNLLKLLEKHSGVLAA